MMRRRRRSTAASLAAALALTATLGACGGSGAEDAAEPSATQTAANGEVFNQADVDFATAMVPHHAQAVQMAVMTRGRDLAPEVEELAAAIRDAQVPEVELMSDWLTAWGQEIPETSLDHANAGHGAAGHGGGGMEDMPGMLSADEMVALEDASGADFERLWLEMMIRHHEGAIEMAEAEQAEGLHPDALALAETIIADQEAEIARMEAMLG